ncbi:MULTISPECIES: PhzF family phenazine biosynthesis protein [unclassified Roseitalea]|uniref:PhzF family phenazine biosynthesis protein n=1 Tax=unclassified Roseitalea TaxID=2639107 RepID=UPI00273DF712|nr:MULTISPECIES: PhzF family phenazine biosynthesis protein [unclassified Roseitalea]
MSHAYAIYDVFTQTAFAGNPLAVVFDAEGLDDAAMGRIAREFNLSETIFLMPPANPAHSCAARIFMPAGELPFAGHPTVGGAIALSERDGGPMDRLMVIEEAIGPVRVALHGGAVPYAEFDLPRLPEAQTPVLDTGAVAAALGLAPSEIGFENHVISQWDAGVPYLCVPVANREAIARARFDEAAWLAHFDGFDPLDVLCPYLYCRQSVGHDSAFSVRMFGPHHGIAEDPATGSAAAAFAGAIERFDGLAEGPNAWWIEQGIDMGRPSRIRLEATGRNGTMDAARIGGHAVKVAEGRLLM